MGTSLKASQSRPQRRPIGSAAEPAAGAGRTPPHISHLIGFGILLTAALLIAIGSFATSSHSSATDPVAEANTNASVAGRGFQR